MEHADVKAGFHKDLLPDWGGKAADILNQPKCWSSHEFNKEYTRNQRSLLGKKKDGTLNPDRTRLYKQNQPAHKRISTLPGSAEGSLIGQDPIFGSSETKDKSIASLRIKEKVDFFRENEKEKQDLFKRIEEREKKHRIETNTRNLILENKWLCDDKVKCLEHWKLLRELKEKVNQSQSPQEKLEIYENWPHPPQPNHSPEDLIKKRAYNAKKRNKRFSRVAEERRKIEDERNQYVRYLHNKKEILETLKLEEEKRRAAISQMQKLIILASRTQVWRVEFERQREKLRKEKQLSEHVIAIQRYWKKSKAEEYGRKYRNAVVAVRKFVIKASAWKKERREKESAEIILWAITELENSNFRKVVHSFRAKVIQCQRYWRQFDIITKSRLKILAALWDKVEKEMMKNEKKKLVEAQKVAQAESKGFTESFKEKHNTSLKDKDESRKTMSPRMHSFMIRSNTKTDLKSKSGKKRLSKRQSSKLINRASTRNRLERGKSKIGQLNEKRVHRPQMTPTLEAAVEMGMQMQRRVPKNIKMDLLQQHLNVKRAEFRQEWSNRKRAEGILKAQAQMLSLEDVAILLKAPSHEAAQKILEEKFLAQEQAEANSPIFFKLLSTTDTATIQAMIERGRQIVEEQFLADLQVREEEEDDDVSQKEPSMSTFLTTSITLGMTPLPE